MHDSARRPTPAAIAAPLAVVALFLLSGCGPSLFDRIGNLGSLNLFGIVVVILDVIALIELFGGDKSVGAKVGWTLVIIFFPVLGCALYYFFGRS